MMTFIVSQLFYTKKSFALLKIVSENKTFNYYMKKSVLCLVNKIIHVFMVRVTTILHHLGPLLALAQRDTLALIVNMV